MSRDIPPLKLRPTKKPKASPTEKTERSVKDVLTEFRAKTPREAKTPTSFGVDNLPSLLWNYFRAEYPEFMGTPVPPSKKDYGILKAHVKTIYSDFSDLTSDDWRKMVRWSTRNWDRIAPGSVKRKDYISFSKFAINFKKLLQEWSIDRLVQNEEKVEQGKIDFWRSQYESVNKMLSRYKAMYYELRDSVHDAPEKLTRAEELLKMDETLFREITYALDHAFMYLTNMEYLLYGDAYSSERKIDRNPMDEYTGYGTRKDLYLKLRDFNNLMDTLVPVYHVVSMTFSSPAYSLNEKLKKLHGHYLQDNPQTPVEMVSLEEAREAFLARWEEDFGDDKGGIIGG